ncbi:MAG TPA: CHAD domain-containing protein, partial [Caldimonas sp.]|nr:CHAD domain-containing protein [Caldimonas sp.]
EGQVARDAVFHALGAWRDRAISDALRARLTGSERERSDGGPSADEARSIVDAVRSKPFQSALLDVVGAMLVAADRARAEGGAGPKVVRRRISDRLQTLRRGVRDDAREFRQLDAAARHAARKRVKRLRYLVDLVGPLYGARRAKAYSAVLGEAQQALGTYLDLVVALQALGPAVAETDLSSRAGLERMREEAAVALKRCKGPLNRAAAARPFWR